MTDRLEQRVLILAPTAKDALTSTRIFEQAKLDPFICKDLPDLCQELEKGMGVALIMQEAILEDKEGLLVKTLERQPAWSDYPLIVLTQTGSTSSNIAGALEAVGHMTLMKRPLELSTLLSAVKSALRERNRQYAARDFLREKEVQAAQLKEAKIKAEEANRAKSDFLTNMSHEIRTPMNAIVGLTHILTTMPVNEERRQEFLKTLQLSAQSLMELINDLLDIAKIENEKVELERAPFGLRKLIEEVIIIASVKAREKGIVLSLETALEADRIFIGDQTRIKQILMNLISNAVKFTEDGTVVLKLEVQPSIDTETALVSIDIIDTGIGIPKQKLGAIFNKFSQADSSVTRKYGGTGLGLAITKHLVELMNGSISVASEPGVGSVFTINLPLAYGSSKASRRKPHADLSPGTVPANMPEILLVEDYEPNILVAKAMLENLGYPCRVARNGKEALEILEKHYFKLVLMDVQMPVLDGYSTAKIIREKEARSETPRTIILGITAHALAGDKEKCLSAGMDDYLPKPFNSLELQNKIKLLYN